MKRPSPGWILPLAALLACFATRCTDVAVFQDEDGKTVAVGSGPDVPPVIIDEDGARAPTPTPGPYEPVYPITPPAPTPTPK
jgi:hypothetical protein